MNLTGGLMKRKCNSLIILTILVFTLFCIHPVISAGLSQTENHFKTNTQTAIQENDSGTDEVKRKRKKKQKKGKKKGKKKKKKQKRPKRKNRRR